MLAYAWGLDMVKALCERPCWARWLLRLAMGRHAYREFLGLVDVIDDGYMRMPGCSTYDLQNMGYHRESLPWDWTDKLQNPESR